MTKENFLRCISPIDGSIYVERPLSTIETASDAVKKARSAQQEWASRTLDERIALVQKGIELIGEQNDDIVTELAWQMGRPIRFGGEFGGFKERADYMAKIANKALEPIVVEKSEAFERTIRRDAAGLVLVVAPWNYPYMTAINTVAPALIAGNAVLLKHASQTPLVGERLVNAFVAAGVPSAVFQNIFLSHENTSKLISHRSFDCINFTGSVSGGKSN